MVHVVEEMDAQAWMSSGDEDMDFLPISNLTAREDLRTISGSGQDSDKPCKIPRMKSLCSSSRCFIWIYNLVANCLHKIYINIVTA